MGFNYRISDINAALGASQIDHINNFLKKRDQISKVYKKKILNNYVEFQKHEKNSYSTNHLFIIKVNKNIHKALFNNLRKKDYREDIVF